MAVLYRVQVNWTGARVVGGGISTHYFTQAGGTAQQAVTALETMWAAIDALMFGDTSWATDPEVQEIESTTGLIVGVDFPSVGGGTGGSGTSPLPAANQGLIQWRTGAVVNGRQLRGRTFVPGLTIGDVTVGGNMQAGSQGTIDAAATALMTNASSELVVYSRKHKVHALVTDVTVAPKFSVLRGRRD